MTLHIVFLDRGTFHPMIEFPLSHLADCHWQAYDQTLPPDLPGRSASADILITNKVRLDRDQLGRLPALKLIAVAATGVDHVDLAAARQHGIAVCNVGQYAIHTVPEHVFGLILALRRRLFDYAGAVHSGAWARSPVFCLQAWPIEDLFGSTLGIVGGGTLGQAVARLAQAFGMQVLFAERRGATGIRPDRTAFERVLEASDVLSLHVPLTDETRQLIGVAELARMKPNAILVNAARGGVVDEQALLAALQAGMLAGAAVDVLVTEPPPDDHPLLRTRLPNLIVTPHIAWASRQAQQTLANEVMANIDAFQRGERRNRVA